MDAKSQPPKFPFSAGGLIPLNLIQEAGCCAPADQAGAPNETRFRSGCMVCGAELVYFEAHREQTCHYCGQRLQANAACARGHFVCDGCHSAEAREVIRQVCLHTREADPVALLQTVRSHPLFPIHGPEHHALVPAVILAALRNHGVAVADQQIESAIQRGRSVAGGACAFLGACGAAVGVGIAVSLLLAATPYRGEGRQAALQATLAALGRIAAYEAPHCCQRDCWLALGAAADSVQAVTGVCLRVEPIACTQYNQNKECIRQQCPLWPEGQ